MEGGRCVVRACTHFIKGILLWFLDDIKLVPSCSNRYEICEDDEHGSVVSDDNLDLEMMNVIVSIPYHFLLESTG